MSPVAMAKHEGHKAIGARQRKHFRMTYLHEVEMIIALLPH